MTAEDADDADRQSVPPGNAQLLVRITLRATGLVLPGVASAE
jgi:hypothetical protein